MRHEDAVELVSGLSVLIRLLLLVPLVDRECSSDRRTDRLMGQVYGLCNHVASIALSVSQRVVVVCALSRASD